MQQRLTINNQPLDIVTKPSDTLLSILRYQLDMVGTKEGCDKGDCGACTVLINGDPTLSCLSLAQLINHDDLITTIEGLNAPEKIDILALAFDKLGALQCGFCQPGMILSAKALLAANKAPSLLEIKHALSGNLCRCTGYSKIYAAILCASFVLSGQASSLDEAIELWRSGSLL